MGQGHNEPDTAAIPPVRELHDIKNEADNGRTNTASSQTMDANNAAVPPTKTLFR